MTAAATDLSNLASVKQWIGGTLTGADTDAVLQLALSAASRFLMAQMGRPFLLPRTYTEKYDGQGYARTRIMLRQFPVISIASLSVDLTSIPAGTPWAPGGGAPNGYLLDPWDGMPPGRPQPLDLAGGYTYGCGMQNVAIAYLAGYQVSSEAGTIPATPYQITSVAAPWGAWGSDQGVTFAATGVALTKITTGTPASGQYKVTGDIGGVPTYTFAAADTGLAVLISYGFVPADLQQITNELVSERWAYRTRVGITTKSLGGQETMSFSQKDMSATARSMLNPYARFY